MHGMYVGLGEMRGGPKEMWLCQEETRAWNTAVAEDVRTVLVVLI